MKKKRMNRTSISASVAILILPLFFLGDRAIGIILNKIGDSSNFRYSRLYSGTAVADVVLIGNSRGHCLYEPYIQEVTGLSTVNLSYNALPTELAHALLFDYLDKYSPKKIVIDVTMANITDTAMIKNMKLYFSKSDRIASLLKETSFLTYQACEAVNLYRFNTEIFHRCLFFLRKKDNDWILNKSMTEKQAQNAKKLPVITFQVSENRMKLLGEIINRAKEKKVEVQLVLAPYYADYLNKVTNLESYLSAIERVTGVKVHDFSRLIEDRNCFSDYLHLNKEGSLIFINKMKEEGIL